MNEKKYIFITIPDNVATKQIHWSLLIFSRLTENNHKFYIYDSREIKDEEATMIFNEYKYRDLNLQLILTALTNSKETINCESIIIVETLTQKEKFDPNCAIYVAININDALYQINKQVITIREICDKAKKFDSEVKVHNFRKKFVDQLIQKTKNVNDKLNALHFHKQKRKSDSFLEKPTNDDTNPRKKTPQNQYSI